MITNKIKKIETTLASIFSTFRNLSFLAVFLGVLATASSSFAEPFHMNHFRPGELASAIRFNELVDELVRIQTPITIEELLGSWSCEKFIFADTSLPDYYQAVDTDGLWYALQVNISFFQNPAGYSSTYGWESQDKNPFVPAPLDGCASGGKLSVYSGMVGVTAPICGTTDTEVLALDVKSRPSSSRIIMQQQYSNTIGALRATLLCDKQNIPPAAPGELSVSVDTNQVNLSWKDQSINELGYKVYRRDSLTGNFTEVSSISANEQSAQLALPAERPVWFGVRAYNQAGESLMSNVVKVEETSAN